MAAPRAPKVMTFTPVVRFPIETDADRVAEKLAWALHGEVVATMQTERNAQVKIGLSEIGTDCMKCLARKLSMEYVDDSTGWKAQVGTAVHAMLEEHIRDRYHGSLNMEEYSEDELDALGAFIGLRVQATKDRIAEFAKALGAVDVKFHLEETVVLREFPGWDTPAGSWPGFTLDGHCDLMVEITLADGTVFCIVVDWKCLGPKSLAEKAAGHLGSTYEHQLPAYGLGWTLRGHTVTHVMLAGVPRDGDLPQSAFVIDRYDPQPVIARLALMENMIDTARLMGWERVVEAQPRKSFCFDCNRFEASESKSFMDAFR